VAAGPDGDVYLPAIYDSDKPDLSDEFLLGRVTDWVGPEEGAVLGIGQRVFLVGDDAINIMDLTTLRFGT
jgi:type VI secretion system protein ImpE